MRKYILSLALSLLCALTMSVSAQMRMKITLTDGTVQYIPVADIESIVWNDADPDPLPVAASGRLELPAAKEGNLYIEHSTTESGSKVISYSLEYDTQANHARWVAFRFDAKTRGKNVQRSNNFQDDPALPSEYWHGAGGFGSGYDRGHICASSDRLYSKAANEQTFYMTNMSPQMSRFNQDYWVCFEQLVQDWGRSSSFCDTLYVVKGGTLDQTLGTRSHGGKEIAIPSYYFMALLKCKNNVYSAMAFWMEHKDFGMKNISNAQMAKHAISIEELEKLTGIDFFFNLPDDCEETIESSLSLSDWNLSK